MLRNTSLSGGDTFFTIALGLIVTPLIIRNFGIEYFGLYVVLSMLSVGGVLGLFDLGLEGTLLKFVSRAHAKANRRRAFEYFGYGLLAFTFIGGVISLAMYVLSGVLASHLQTEKLAPDMILTCVYFVSANALIQFVSSGLAATLMGLGRYDVAKGSNIFSNMMYLLGVGGVVNYGQPFPLIFLALVCTSSTRLVILAIAASRQFRNTTRPASSIVRARHFANASLQLLLNRFIGVTYNFFPRILLTSAGALASLGVYDALSKFPNFLRIVLSVLNSAVIPEFTALTGKKNLRRARAKIGKLLELSFLICVPLCIFIFFNIKYLIFLWVGDEVSRFSGIAQILVLAISLRIIPALNSTISVSLGFLLDSSKLGFYSLLCAILSSLILYPEFNLLGLALAYLVAELVLVISHCRLLEKRFGVSILNWAGFTPRFAIIVILAVGFQCANMLIIESAAYRISISAILSISTYFVGFFALSRVLQNRIMLLGRRALYRVYR